MLARVYTKTYEAEERLVSLGLRNEVLHEAARAGLLAWSTSNPFHPIWYAGNMLYSNTLASLGELLSNAKDGWNREDPAGHPLVVNHKRKLALAIATSDSNTGNGDVSNPPSTRPAKGVRTQEAIEENQGLLFPDLFDGSEIRHELMGYEFWWLLMHIDESANVLKLELSRGIRLSKERSIAGWSERVMLTSQPLNGGDMTLTREPDGNGPQNGEYDVEVRRIG
jgi:hypothetical protein